MNNNMGYNGMNNTNSNGNNYNMNNSDNNGMDNKNNSNAMYNYNAMNNTSNMSDMNNVPNMSGMQPMDNSNVIPNTDSMQNVNNYANNDSIKNEKNDKVKDIIIGMLLLIIIALIILLILVYNGTINLSKSQVNNGNNLSNSNSLVDENKDDLLNIGLDLYKFATGNGTGPFKWNTDNSECTNYIDVISKFTQEYFNYDDKGFAIPYRDSDGKWLSMGGAGTENISNFKNITIENQTSDTATFKIEYSYKPMDNETAGFTDSTDTFIIKKVDNEWKIDSFKLIYGLQFNS